MKVQSLTIQKAMANINVLADTETDKQTDGQTNRLKSTYPRSIDAGA